MLADVTKRRDDVLVIAGNRCRRLPVTVREPACTRLDAGAGRRALVFGDDFDVGCTSPQHENGNDGFHEAVPSALGVPSFATGHFGPRCAAACATCAAKTMGIATNQLQLTVLGVGSAPRI